ASAMTQCPPAGGMRLWGPSDTGGGAPPSRRAVRKASSGRFGRAVASFITGNGSCNCSRQYASWAAMSGCDRDCRCQYAKSAYCIESGGGGGAGGSAEEGGSSTAAAPLRDSSDQTSAISQCALAN